MPDQLWWFIARSTGIVTLVASGTAVAWGLLLSTRVIRRRSLPKWLLDLHRFLGAITIGALTLHLVALVADSYVEFTVADLAVPFHSDWKTVAVAWGVVAAYLLVLVQASSLLKKHLPLDAWRRMHLASFPAYILSVVHGATAGTDTGNRAYLVIVFLLTTFILFLTLVRVLASAANGTTRQAGRSNGGCNVAAPPAQ